MIFTFSYCQSQKLKVEYRTVTDEHLRLHYLIFIDNTKCKLIYPVLSHGEAMMGRSKEYKFNYSVKNDTLKFSSTDPMNADSTMNSFTASTFIILKDGKIYNSTSGYTYLDRKLVSYKYLIYVIDGEIFKTKNAKVNGYGELIRDYKTNRKLKRRISKIDIDKYNLKIVRGLPSYEKYGVLGMDGVIEVTKRTE